MGLGVGVFTAGGALTDAPSGATDGSEGLSMYATEAGTTTENGAVDENLLENPNCEDEGNGPDGWESTGGGSVGCFADAGDLDPEYGDYIFAHASGDLPASIAQSVDVNGGSTYQLTAFAGATTGMDDVTVEVSYRQDGDPIDGGEILLEEKPEEVDTWVEYTEASTAPEDADEAVVEMSFDTGDGDFSDAFVDRITFSEFSDAPTAFGVEGVEMGAQQTLEPEWTLFDNEFAEDEDDLGSEPAELVSFGGGDLGGDVTSNEAGDEVDLAGGTLQVNADGSLSLTEPALAGEYSFEYRIEKDDGRSDDATVTIEVGNHELENPACTEGDGDAVGWNSVGTDDVICLNLADDEDTDHTAPVGEKALAGSASTDAIAEQTVWVVPGEEYTIEGLVGTDPGDDYGEVDVEYLDADGDVIDDEGVSLSDLQSTAGDEFDRFVDSSVAPEEARQAVVRVSKVSQGGQWTGVYFDDLSFEPGEPQAEPVIAYDVAGLEVGVERTLAPDESLFTLGDQSDDLGFPQADLVSFGGGDLGGDVTSNDPGDEVDVAGGTLQVDADGTFRLTEPTETGVYSFEYHIENDEDSDDATVEIRVRDHTLVNPTCDGGTDGWTDASPDESRMGCVDPSEETSQTPVNGTRAFGDADGAGEFASLEQTAPIRGGLVYEISGFVGTDDDVSSDDYAEVEVRFLDEDGDELPDGGVTLSELRSASSEEFDAFDEQTAAPEDAFDAVVRITVSEEDGDGFAEAYLDDLSFEELGVAPVTADVTGPSVGIGETLEENVSADFGDGADDLGEPEGEVVSFGGGDLDGDATEYDADEDSATLAGGELTLEADGTLTLAEPATDGTYEFDYRLENDAGSDEATVTIEVIDQSFFEVSIDETNEPVEGETLTIDATVENTGDNDGTRAVALEIEDEIEAIVFDDEQEVSLEEGANDTVSFEWETEADQGGAYDATISSGDDDATASLTVFSRVDLEGTVVDQQAHSPSDAPIEGASVTLTHPDGSEDETTTNGEGEFAFEDVPGTGEEYELDASAVGYESNGTTVTVDDLEPIDDVSVGLEGNATVSGQIEDTTFETGVPDIDVSVESATGTYTGETDEDGAYAIAVPGTGDEYTVSADPDGWEESSTTAAVGDGEAVTGVDLELTGDADVGITWRDNRTDERLEGVIVTVESDNLGSTEFTSDDSGQMEFTVPSGQLYTLTTSKDGYRDREIPIPPDSGRNTANFVIGGNAELTGSVTDAESGGEIEGATVSAENGAGAYSATTGWDGSYEIDVLPGGHDYEVTIERDGYEPVTISEEHVADGGDHERDVELSGDAAIEVEVVSDRTGDGLEDVTVEAVGSDGAGPYTASTDGDWTIVFEAVSSADSYDLDIANDGYDTVTIEDVDLESGETAELEATLEYSASIDGTVTDRLTGEPIEAVDLEFTENATGTTFTVESATDADGEYDVPVPGYVDLDTEYGVSASADGYEPETERTATVVRPGDSETVDVTLQVPGENAVFGEVTDAVTDEPIADATVTLEIDDERVDSELAYETETSANGSYELTDVVGGYDYTLTADADGYDAETASLRVDGDEEVDLALAGDGALTLDVGGEQFGDELENAAVEATPVDGGGVYDGAHDGDGTYTVDELPSGVEYAVTVAAAGYESAERDVLIEEPGTTTPAEAVSLDGDAALEVEAADSVTDGSLEDVSVTIEREADGAQFEPAETTDDDGALSVTVPGTGDEYTVTASVTGYDGATVSTNDVDAGASVPVSITLEGDSAIEGTVSDRVTGDALEGAAVTAEANGAHVETTTASNGSYGLTGVPGERSYEVTLEADGYRSNATTVTPSAETVAVNDSLWLAHDGDGTDEEPYRITNVSELQAIGAALDAHYVLENHIDATEADAWYDGDGFEPIGDDESPFTGSLDGQEHAIESLTVDRAGDSAVGLFGVVDGASIETLALENASVTGDEHVGGVAGSLSAGSIDAVAVSGTVTGEESVGGLVGSGGDVSTVRSSATVEGATTVGGLVGETDGNVAGSLAVGAVTGTTDTGGLVGAGTPTVESSYWDAIKTTRDGSAGSPDADGLNTSALVGANVTGNTTLEFDSEWAALDGEYPRHGWMVDALTLSLADDSMEPGETTEPIVSADFVDGSTAYANETSALSSSDSDVLGVENSTVEALDDGLANLTATLVGTESTMPVEVESPSSSSRSPDIAITGIDYTGSEPRVGESVDVTVTLENDGNRGGRYTIESTLDGEPYEEYNAFVGASQTKQVTFTYGFEKTGTYTVTVGDQSVTLEVVDANDDYDDEETEDSTDSSDEESDADESSGSDDDGDDADVAGDDELDGQDDQSGGTDQSDDTVPGFGLLLTLGVLLATLLVARHR